MNHESEEHLLHQVSMMEANIDKNKIMFDFVCFPGQEKYEMYDEIVSLGATVYVCPQYDMKNQMGFLRWWTDFFNKHKEYKATITKAEQLKTQSIRNE